MTQDVIRCDFDGCVKGIEKLHSEVAVMYSGDRSPHSYLGNVTRNGANFDGVCGRDVIFRVDEEGCLCYHLAEWRDDCIFSKREVRAAQVEGTRDKRNLFIFQGEVALRWMNGAVVLAEEIPAQNKVVDQVSHNPAIHPHVATFDAEADVDDSNGFDLAPIDADGVAFEGADDVFVQVRVLT